MDMTPAISVVVPFLNEEASIQPLYGQLHDVLAGSGASYELLFVDDGSTDGSAARVKEIALVDSSVHLVALRGHYGKSAALAAGFDQARGDVVFTMDADLQDDPREIPRFLAKLAEGFDLVSGYKHVRHDPWGKVLASRVFNLLVRVATGLGLHDVNCGFKCYRKVVVEELRGSVYGELHRLLPVLAYWKRFQIAEIEVEHHAREHGRSKFGWSRYFAGIMDLITVSFLLRFRVRPSHLFGWIGSVFGLLGAVICGYLAVLWFLGDRPIGDRPLLMFGVLLILVGVQLLATGLMAELLVYATQRRERPYELAVADEAQHHSADTMRAGAMAPLITQSIRNTPSTKRAR